MRSGFSLSLTESDTGLGPEMNRIAIDHGKPAATCSQRSANKYIRTLERKATGSTFWP